MSEKNIMQDPGFASEAEGTWRIYLHPLKEHTDKDTEEEERIPYPLVTS